MLQGKKGVILGVANKRSIAWAVAKAAVAEGAEVVLTYQNERMEKSVRALAETLPGDTPCIPCDVDDEAQVAAFGDAVGEHAGKIDFLVHSIAYANPDELKGEFHHTSRAGFRKALETSVHSFIALSNAVDEHLNDGGSLVTLSYIGAVRIIPNYNLMGVAKAALEATMRYLAYDLGPRAIRANAVSAGPIKTLSAVGIGDFQRIISHVEEMAPLRRNVDADEVADAVTFMLSDKARGITGTVLYVDAGYHAMGL
jgi:enoyl-[acyl-carrier protein] reductase I